jgi:hypothetical protein
MKIVKEVVIRATVFDTWSWLTKDETLKGIMNGASDATLSQKFSHPAVAASKLSAEPPRKLSMGGGMISPDIITTFELSERGERTGLRLTISGWEDIDPEIARMEMPMLSLAWEKKLGLFKFAIESEAINHAKVL